MCGKCSYTIVSYPWGGTTFGVLVFCGAAAHTEKPVVVGCWLHVLQLPITMQCTVPLQTAPGAHADFHFTPQHRQGRKHHGVVALALIHQCALSQVLATFYKWWFCSVHLGDS